MSKSWTSTLRLPKNNFQTRPPQGQKWDKYIQRCADELYAWQSANRDPSNEFILHDGPPYANGELHAGHALNKILKDIIIRRKVQQGRRVKYIPGWDCHGLPIELKAVGTAEGKKMSPGAIRKAARKLASKAVLNQMKSFRSYAVMGDWEKRWTTMDKDFEVKQLRLFQRMVKKGLIYRKFKPVYWSPSSATALAESELEYEDNHVSTAAWVKFPLTTDLSHIPGLEHCKGPTSAVIWTTTPWTLPANQFLAVRDDLEYDVATLKGHEGFIVVKSIPKAWEIEKHGTILGSELKKVQYIHPLHRDLPPKPIIHAAFVKDDAGSGIVHCAPAHGWDDYLVCPLDITVSAPIDNEGLFTEAAYPTDPSKLKGIPVLNGGNQAVMDLLGPEHVIQADKFTHTYPYDWRTKQPVIIRATAQWFANVGSIKDLAISTLKDEEVRFVPESGWNRLQAFVKGRSEWCISRQRAWGVPIPALYDSNGEAIMTEESLDHIISVIQERGIDAWWNDDPADQAWVPESLRGKGDYTRGRDTMDVWFDSGSSWTQTDKQADVYLEGTDQHRGWFQSSLLTRVAAMANENISASTTNTLGLSPFKTLITHGFTLDKDGKKMSKSLGNVISADQVMDGSLLPDIKIKKKVREGVKEALGPDALRLWAAGSDYTGDVILGETVLTTVHQVLTKYRTIVRMILGNLHASARTAPLSTADHIALLQLQYTMDEVGKHYDNYEFNKAFASINRWLFTDFSALYLEAVKDRLYCGDGGSVIEPIFMGFMRMIAPLTPVLVEEAWESLPQWMAEDTDLVHPLKQLYTAPLLPAEKELTLDMDQLRKDLPLLMDVHKAIKAASENARTDKVLGSSLQCRVVLQTSSQEVVETLERYGKEELADLFVLSSFEAVQGDVVVEGEAWKYSVDITGLDGSVVHVLPPKDHKCPRCWKYTAPVEEGLCERCEDAVEEYEAAKGTDETLISLLTPPISILDNLVE
ncbi:isoleucyl-tRNA synthetase [Podospora fimiseda]|uniref:Isoleucine--tRNA ligase, mitochondrial n=1 Tax=Podospora fimiseda TaxID=252190 RepID=A0AAN7H7K8_9PEZI|nr:isoleucyl-tRNA synthetase [Podospora fimiseda]